MFFEFSERAVEIIIIELFLHFHFMQAFLMFNKVLIIHILPLFTYILLVKVVTFIRDERTFQLSLL